jgi:hypothetical protein
MEEIERQAEAVLARVPSWIWDGESLPIPIEEIADSVFGLLVREVDDLGTAPGAPKLAAGQSLSGLLLPVHGEIWVKADEAQRWPGRRRFTIGHEMGHWWMHRTDHGAVFCRSSTVEPEDGSAGAHPEVPLLEQEAQVFAAAMLMPAWLVREHYSPGCDFFGLCELFGASGAAMGRRLHAVI